VANLISHGIKILVQPSPQRIFQDNEYQKAGATITDDLTSASIIIGLKEVQPEYMIPNKT